MRIDTRILLLARSQIAHFSHVFSDIRGANATGERTDE